MATCRRCGGEALTIDQLVEQSKALGVYVSPDGTVIAPRSHAAVAEGLENLKGFACRACGSVYCMACILGFAPAHANGGKACFDCRGAYGLVRA